MCTNQNFESFTRRAIHSTLDWALLYIALTKRMTHSSTPSFLKLHHSTLQGTLSKAFSRSAKVTYIVFCFQWCFSCIYLRIKIASAVLRLDMNPNYMLSISTCCLIMASIMSSRTFIVCSSNFKPRQLPHLVVSLFPLKQFIFVEWSHSSGICSSLIIRLIISVMTS